MMGGFCCVAVGFALGWIVRGKPTGARKGIRQGKRNRVLNLVLCCCLVCSIKCLLWVVRLSELCCDVAVGRVLGAWGEEVSVAREGGMRQEESVGKKTTKREKGGGKCSSKV